MSAAMAAKIVAQFERSSINMLDRARLAACMVIEKGRPSTREEVLALDEAACFFRATVRDFNTAFERWSDARIVHAEAIIGGTTGQMERALRVITTDTRIRAWLEANDPKALEQAEGALEGKAAPGTPRVCT